jgi:hypothetical protein
MKAVRKVYTLTATDADGVAASQTPSGAGNLTIDGVLASGGVVTLTTAQPVTVYGTGNEAGKTFTVYGTDQNGMAISEAIAGPNNGTVTTSASFKTVTRVAVSAATAAAITVGVTAVLSLPWIPLNRHKKPFEYSYYVDIGTATYQVETTLNDVQDTSVTPVVNATPTGSGSADAGGNLKTICTAIRVKVTAFTSGNIVLTLVG